MALRFTGSDSGGDAPRPAVAARTRLADLRGQAQELLGAGELDGFGGLLGSAAEGEEPQGAYGESVTLLEAGFAAGGQLDARYLPALFATIAAGAAGMLEREPREPRLLNYLGVALYELWSLDGAAAAFEAALRLDPALESASGNLRALIERRRQLGGKRVELHPSVPELSRRAIELGGLAQPAEGLRLSLCMIVRDEQEMLPRCLGAVAGAVDEIVIVDTGSTDTTVEIARRFGARVIEREWTGSFAEARNVSFDAAEGDWLMYLDADEVLQREDAPLLRALTTRTWREAFYLSETNYTGEIEEGTAVTHNALRVFRNRHHYRFEGRLHEQIAHRLPGHLPERLEATAVRVEHYGYLGVVRDRREKSRRNIELLRLQQAEGPPTPFLHYNLGSEYAAAGDARAALAEFERAWGLIEQSVDCDRYEFAPALMTRLVKALRVCGRPAEAIAKAEDGLLRFPGFTDLVYEQGVAAGDLGEAERAALYFERCIEMGDAPRQYTATVGCGSYLPRVQLAELCSARGEGERAIELLEWCLREHPKFTGSVLPYAGALLAAGVEPEQLVARIKGQMPAMPSAARLIIATVLYEAGASDAGRAALRDQQTVALGAEAVCLLQALLRALLKVQDFDAFEQVHALLVATPIAARERHQLLAEMYLGQGFLASAAEEWMAVCSEQQPDSPALLGLAQVAAARGMEREADEFTAAARALERQEA
ncbi:MAG TPA: glycosyltransferase family 2 protein [Solirubrobacteraceae bacterium]|nr:glycosyltransferase family 2 protein [Solirubrobacteraceae bacterium]